MVTEESQLEELQTHLKPTETTEHRASEGQRTLHPEELTTTFEPQLQEQAQLVLVVSVTQNQLEQADGQRSLQDVKESQLEELVIPTLRATSSTEQQHHEDGDLVAQSSLGELVEPQKETITHDSQGTGLNALDTKKETELPSIGDSSKSNTNVTSKANADQVDEEESDWSRVRVPQYPECIPISQRKIDKVRYQEAKDRGLGELACRLASIINEPSASSKVFGEDDYDFEDGGSADEQNACEASSVVSMQHSSIFPSTILPSCDYRMKNRPMMEKGWRKRMNSEEMQTRLKTTRKWHERKKSRQTLRALASFLGIHETGSNIPEPRHRFSASRLASHQEHSSRSIAVSLLTTAIREAQSTTSGSKLSKISDPNVVPVRMIIPYTDHLTNDTVSAALKAGQYEACKAWAKLRLDFRITIDFRKVNENLYQLEHPFPDLEEVGEYLAGAQFFGVFDLVDGYTQCSLDKGSKEIFSVVTKEGVFTPERVPQGASCSVGYFQASMERVYRPILKKGALVYIDDLIVYGRTIEEYFERMEEVLRLSRKHNIFISAKKGQLLSKEVTWCGKLISGKGIRHSQDRIDGLLALPIPSTGDQLWQFVGASTWMCEHIPRYNEITQVLQDCLTKVKKAAGTGFVKKKGCVKVVLNEKVGWDAKCVEAFLALKDAIRHQAMLAHPDKNKEFILCTDASKDHWGGVVTQVTSAKWLELLATNPALPPDEGITKSGHPSPSMAQIAALDHQPLAFISGSFKGCQLRWSTLEKEAFAIRTALLRYEHLFLRSKGVIVLTDHRNLEFLFGKESSKSLPAYVRDKLLRWYVSIASIPYRIR
eukprot:GHVU01144439.1.p1 GENE.GHVU01144439.1~~GHVU01144439.1.p1  ORF type:complete len:931 (+),score=150.93 GHVU01144439.1:316-2793(+)